MKSTQQYFSMSDGKEIFVRKYEVEQPVGHIHILHGMAEHSARYDSFAELLAEGGYFVTLHDHRGHGYTVQEDEPFGYFADNNGFARVVQDVHEVLQQLKAQYQLPKPIIFGHSMGSFITRRYMQLYSAEMDKAILCGSGHVTMLHATGHTLATALVAIQGPKEPSKLMTKLSFGSFNKQFQHALTDFDWLCGDPPEVNKYIEDPLCGFTCTNQFFADFTGGLLTLSKEEELKKVRAELPILFISGSEDPVGENGAGVLKAAEQLYQAGTENILVYLFEGMRHEILNEKNKQHVYDVINWWLKENGKEN